jgi:hypothetical protein
MTKNLYQAVLVAASTVAMGLLAGCGTGLGGITDSAPATVAGAALKGNVHGGQQPVAGASIALYAAGTSGYAGTASSLLTRPVTTDAGGGFNITGAYSCSAGQQLYIVATGGNPGGGTNPNLALMAPLGDCSGLSASTFISINEITTVAGAFTLGPFMSGLNALGTTPTNTSGLAHAFASTSKLVNTTTGLAPGSGLPSGATAPTAELYTLADALATCVNSTGGSTGDGTACGTLFKLTTPSGGSAPTDTIQAALNIAHFPTQNVAAIFNMSSATAPFNPQLASAPSDWTMAVSYKAAGSLSSPKTTTIDAAGNVWVANSGNNSVTVLAQSGTPLSGSPFAGNGLTAPSAVTIDIGGNAWVANSGGDTVSVFTPSGAIYSGSPFSGEGTISAPVSIAIDAPGNIWIANSGNSTLTELSSAGTYIAPPGSQGVVSSPTISNPTSLAINPK